jgi:hypothetical protein
MNKNSTLDERISAFAAKLWIAGIPLGHACAAAEAVLNPQPKPLSYRVEGGMHQDCESPDIYDDDSSEWRSA